VHHCAGLGGETLLLGGGACGMLLDVWLYGLVVTSTRCAASLAATLHAPARAALALMSVRSRRRQREQRRRVYAAALSEFERVLLLEYSRLVRPPQGGWP
jgi:hypothetical protein